MTIHHCVTLDVVIQSRKICQLGKFFFKKSVIPDPWFSDFNGWDVSLLFMFRTLFTWFTPVITERLFPLDLEQKRNNRMQLHNKSKVQQHNNNPSVVSQKVWHMCGENPPCKTIFFSLGHTFKLNNDLLWPRLTTKDCYPHHHFSLDSW